jgi:hypothetical protein
MFHHRQLTFALCGCIWCLEARRQRRRTGGSIATNANGFTLQYPANLLVTERAADAGDGKVFASPDDEARLLVGALPNDYGYTPITYQQYIARGLPDRLPPHERQLVCSLGRETVMFTCGGAADQQLCHGLPLRSAPHLRPGG